MKRFTLRYVLIEVALFALAFGLFRVLCVMDAPGSWIIGLPLFMGVFVAAIGGSFGPRCIAIGAISGLILGIAFMVWLLNIDMPVPN